MATPGSYQLNSKKGKEKGKVKGKGKGKGKGRPSLNVRKGTARKFNYRSKYKPEDLEEACKMVKEEGWTASRAAREFGVPRVTIMDNVCGKHNSKVVGRPTQLTPVEEKVFVDLISLMGEYNFPLTKRYLRDMVKNYLDKKRDSVFVDNRPGYKWVRLFLKRHKAQLVTRVPTNIRRSRAEVSPAQIRDYFANLEREVEGVFPSHIFNYDETNLRDDPGAEQCLFKKGIRYPEQVKDHSKTAFSVMFCCAGSGELLPPMTVYKSPASGNFYTSWADGHPIGSVCVANKSGWFNMQEFEVWFTKVFLVYIQYRLPKV